MKDNRIELLKNGNIKTAINKMAAPAIIGLMVMAIYNIVDTMFVAWIGTEATGSTQVVMPIMMLASSIGLSFGIGGGSYLSRLLGQEKFNEAEEVASTSFFSAIVMGLLFTIVTFIFFEDILRFFGANDSILDLAMSYAVYIVGGSVALVINMTLNNLLRAEGSSKLSMIAMVIGAGLNIILDPILIFGFGWGVAGAAIGTIASQIVTMIILLSAYLHGKSVVKIKLKSFVFDTKVFMEIFKVGFPTFVKQVLFSVSMGMLNTASVVYGGTDLLAALGIISRVTMLPTYIIFGLGQGFQPVAGYNIGANNKERLMSAFKYTLISSTILALITSILLVLLGEPIFNLFRATDEVVTYGIKGLNYYAIGLIFLGISNTVAVFFQSLGKGIEALIMSAARQGLVFIPLIIILPQYFGETGVVMTQMVADIATVIMAFTLVVPFIKSERLNFHLAKAA